MTDDIKIKGPALSNKQIEVINLLKTFEKEVLESIDLLKNQTDFLIDKSWIETGEKDFQKSFMCFVKGIAVESK